MTLNVTMENRSDTYKAVIKTLEPLFREAREKGKRFHCTSFLADVTMTPDEYEAKLQAGLFVWGA